MPGKEPTYQNQYTDELARAFEQQVVHEKQRDEGRAEDQVARVRNEKLARAGQYVFALGLIGAAVYFLSQDPTTGRISLIATGVLCLLGGGAYWFNRAA